MQHSYKHFKHIQHSHIYTKYNVETHPGKNHKVLFIWHEEIDAPFVYALSCMLSSTYSSLPLQTLPPSHAL